MIDNNKNNLQELSIVELQTVEGGSFFRTLGAAAHEIWCVIEESFKGDGTRYEPQGYGHYGGARP